MVLKSALCWQCGVSKPTHRDLAISDAIWDNRGSYHTRVIWGLCGSVAYLWKCGCRGWLWSRWKHSTKKLFLLWATARGPLWLLCNGRDGVSYTSQTQLMPLLQDLTWHRRKDSLDHLETSPGTDLAKTKTVVMLLLLWLPGNSQCTRACAWLHTRDCVLESAPPSLTRGGGEI